MINERQSYTGDTTECCFYIPDLRSSTIFGFKWADGRSTSTKNVTVASILKQLGLIHTIVEPLATESSAKITIIYFLFVDYLCPELGPKSDSMIQQMVAEIEAECRSFVNLDVNIRATASTNATEFVGIHLKITLDSLQSQQPNELARSVITNSVLEYDLGVTKNSLHFEDTNLTPVKIDKQGMERLTETYFGNIGTKMIYIPDMDRIDFTKLYATGEVPGGIPDHVVKQFEGELVLFRRELTRWLSEDKTGLLLYSYSAKELKNIVHSQVQNQFEFDWLLFRKSHIVAIEVTASGNIRQAVHDKLEQVMTKTIPMMKILIWFFLANDTENFSWILEKNVFEEFMRKHLKIIVFVASASSEDIKTAMTSVLNENFQEESNLKLKFEKSSISTYFVGGQDYGPNERPKFLQFLLNQESKNVEIKVSDKSPLITNSQKTSSNELETIKFLAGTFTVGYLCHDSDKICRLKSDALDPDVRFLESQKKFVDKLVRKASKKLEKYVHISEKLTVILSPQQMKILEEDPNYLLVRGEPGAGKTVLLLAKALECSLDEKVRYIYFCLPHTKQHLKVFIEKFRDFHTDTLGGKFRILSDASSDFIELSKKPFKELHDSVLLIDEFYFDCSEKMRITSFLFHQISASIFPHMKNVWMTSVAIAFFEPSMDLMKEYLPLELFCIKPLNVNFRNSVHIATFCTNYHHRGGVRAFASSYVPGVFTSSEIEIQLSTFKDKIDISFENLSCKFRKSRWVIIFCDELHFGSWHTFLANRESEFSDSFVIQTNGSPTMCDFSGAEVHSVVLIVDPFFTKNQKEVEISEAMYKLAASRAQYELVLFVHQDMKTVLNDFSQSRNFQLDINPEQVRILATDDPDGSKFVDTLYNLARGYLSRERLQSFIEARYPGLNPKLFHDYVAEEKNRRVFILLLKHMGQGIIKFFLQCSRVLTSGEEICGIRFQETDEEYYRDIIKGINVTFFFLKTCVNKASTDCCVIFCSEVITIAFNQKTTASLFRLLKSAVLTRGSYKISKRA